MNIDLNADMGESFGMYTMGDDAGFMPLISSSNIACGFHAGDPCVMRRPVTGAPSRWPRVSSQNFRWMMSICSGIVPTSVAGT